jgi:hypothetical protein
MLAYFRRLWRTFSSGSSQSTNAPAASTRSAPQSITPTDPDERISRYVLDKKHFNSSRVKFRAFEHGDVAISVTRSETLTEQEVWAYGDKWVGQPSGRIIYARGDFTSAVLSDIRANGSTLAIIPDEPPPLHANAVGFPDAGQKEQRRSLAQQLAAKSKVVVRH